MEKFPVNQAQVAGLVTRAVFNDETNRVNVTVKANDQYLNVLISGEERYNNFKESFNKSLSNLGTRTVENVEKQNYPLLKITGEALFHTNEISGTKHKNYTIVASGKLDQKNEKFFLTETKEQQDEFRKEHHSNNVTNNTLSIRGVIASEPKTITTDKGSFITMSVAHNYLQNDVAKTSFADVVLPSTIASEFNKANYQKGSPILLEAKPQMISYEKAGVKVFSFNLITKGIQHDLTNATTVKKASESINKVADITKTKERKDVAENEISALKGKKSEQTM